MIRTNAAALTLLWVLSLTAAADDEGWIDTHVHLDGRYRDGERRPPLVVDYESAARGLIAKMDEYGVRKAIVMPPPQRDGQAGGYDHRALAGIVDAHRDRLALAAGGGTLNPSIHACEPDEVTPAVRRRFVAEAEALVATGARAFGEMTALHLSFNDRHPYLEVAADHPLFLALAEVAGRHRMPIDLHVEAVGHDLVLPDFFDRISRHNPDRLARNIGAIERLLAHDRRAPIVWQHIGWDNVGGMTPTLFERLLTEHPNLYLSLRIEELFLRDRPVHNRIVDAGDRIDPAWRRLIEAHPDRFLIGSDEFFGVPGKTPRRPQSFEETWPLLGQLPPEVARRIGRTNALRLYRLE